MIADGIQQAGRHSVLVEVDSLVAFKGFDRSRSHSRRANTEPVLASRRQDLDRAPGHPTGPVDGYSKRRVSKLRERVVAHRSDVQDVGLECILDAIAFQKVRHVFDAYERVDALRDIWPAKAVTHQALDVSTDTQCCPERVEVFALSK